MAKVTVRFYATIREAVGEKQTEVTAKTIDEVIWRLIEKYGSKFQETIFDKETRQIKPFYNILVNGIRINVREDLKKRVKDGDTIAVFPPVGGG